jgi:hypothetical protein
MKFTPADLRKQFDPGTFARGEDYARRGNVLTITGEGDYIEGTVAGSGRHIYGVGVYLESRQRGIAFDGECSCPMANNCKHVVALLLASLEHDKTRTVTASALPDSAADWLAQLAAARVAHQSGAVPPAVPAYRVAYVLMPEGSDCSLRLNVCKARLRKDGSFAGVTPQNDTYNLLASRPGHFRDGDEEAIRQVAGLQSGRMYAGSVRPFGRMGARLLEQLCTAGQLSQADAPAALKRGDLSHVVKGPARHAAPAWQADDGDTGAVTLRWRFDSGRVVAHVLATEPMLYLDRGILGELLLPESLAKLPPATLVGLVEQAPRLAPEQRARMAVHLVERGLDQILPAPQALQMRKRQDIVPTPCLRLDSHAHLPRRGDWQWYDYAQLWFDYDGLSTEGCDEPILRRKVGDTVELVERNNAAEDAARDLLIDMAFTEADEDTPLVDVPGALQLPGEDEWLAFARFGVPRLRDAGWQIEFDGNYRYELGEVEDW